MVITFYCKEVKYDLATLREGLNHFKKLGEVDVRKACFIFWYINFLHINHWKQVKLFSLKIKGRIHHDPCYPGFKFAFLSKVLDPLKYFHETFLQNIFSLCRS